MVRLLFSSLELRENLTRLGANLKQSLIESARKTWESINEFARAHSTQGADQQDAAVEEATEAIGDLEIIRELKYNVYLPTAVFIAQMLVGPSRQLKQIIQN